MHNSRSWPIAAREDVHMKKPVDISIDLVRDPETFLDKIREYEREPEVFIDIETIDWWSAAPRVALLQVLAGRQVAVFDLLAAGMEHVLVEHFFPTVMANQRVRKWAHNALYERRFLGGARVQNLECTLRLARGIAFHRLPTETLSLASLVSALCGVTLDKTLQAADWRVRPLSEQHLRYAAADTIWCARIRSALEALEQPPRPEDDDPEAIDQAFPEAKRRQLAASDELKVLRESVRSFMKRREISRFSRFRTWTSTRLEAPWRKFVVELDRVDPARMLNLELRVTQEMLDLFDARQQSIVLAACRAAQSVQLRAPRLRLPRGAALSYEVGSDDAERVTRDYESRARTLRMASSLVDELKQRMRAVLELRGMTDFRAWSMAPGTASLFIDVRHGVELAPQWGDRMVPLTKKCQLADRGGGHRAASTSDERVIVCVRPLVSKERRGRSGGSGITLVD